MGGAKLVFKEDKLDHSFTKNNSQLSQASSFVLRRLFIYPKASPSNILDPTFHSPKANSSGQLPNGNFLFQPPHPFRGQPLVSGLAFQNCGPNVSCISGFKSSRQPLGTFTGSMIFQLSRERWDMDSFPFEGIYVQFRWGLTSIISLVFRPRNQGYRRIARQEPGIIGGEGQWWMCGFDSPYHVVNLIPSPNLTGKCHTIQLDPHMSHHQVILADG